MFFRTAVCLLLFSTCVIYGQRLGRKRTKVQMQERMQALARLLETNVTLRTAFEKHVNQFNQPPELKNITLNCTINRSSFPPDTAHRVRPSDIKVVAAAGDSITAGMGILAETIIDMWRNDRGHTFSMGGVQSLDQGMMTLPNVLKKFNPQLGGYSFGEGAWDDPEAGLNVAIAADETNDLRLQIEELVESMQDPEKGVNWDDDWKLITILIGANDLCQYCADEEYFSPDAFMGHMREALDYLQSEEIPRTIVQINSMFDITPLPAFSDDFICDVIQWFACDCATDREEHAKLKWAQQQYHLKLEELINSGRYDTRDDFTVVIQTHFRNATPKTNPEDGRVDRSYWGIDCFHPGQKAHWAFATSLWNNMLEPVGQKREALDWSIGTNLKCPTLENPYIFTRLNSQRGGQLRKVIKEDLLRQFRGRMNHREPPGQHEIEYPPVMDVAYENEDNSAFIGAPAAVSPERKPTRNVGAIVGGTVAALVVAMAAVIVLVKVVAMRKTRVSSDTNGAIAS